LEVFLEHGGYFSVNTPSGKQPKVLVMSVNKQQQALQLVSAILHPEGKHVWQQDWKS
jgi:hypothetical protein